LKSVTWKRLAEEKLQSNILFYAKAGPITAWWVYEEVLKRAEQLGKFPEIGRKGRLKNTREFVLTGTPFILVYHLIANQVEILNVLHGAQ